MFRRRRPVDDDDVEGDAGEGEGDGVGDTASAEFDETADTDDTVDTDQAGEPEETPGARFERASEPPPRPQGPWDVDDAPDDELLDLGGLRVPVIDGYDISITAEGDVPVVVTYSADDGAMQLHAFAAPKSSGIWSEVCDEIAESLRGSGGQADVGAGPFGTELKAMLAMQQPDGTTGLQPARFIGVDGPRWFLRALLSGPAAGDESRSAAFEAIVRRVVVVRGSEAMAPRDVIPLKLPRDVQPALSEADEEASEDDSGDGELPSPLTMPERGPEITEVG